MTKERMIIAAIFVFAVTCNHAIQYFVINYFKDGPETIEVKCDSVFKDKEISIQLAALEISKTQEVDHQYVFTMLKKGKEIFRDTLESTTQEIKFADYNNDHVKDVLIQNSSDVRSNWTYNLFLVDKNVEKIIRIKGFEEIRNPHYLPAYDLIDNRVMSGKNWTSFYKIIADSVRDYNTVIYEEAAENGQITYDVAYRKAVSEIIKNQKVKR